jgi:glycosyltransferase involved in cell wall biosynthesis
MRQIPQIMSTVSWQRAQIRGGNFSHCQLQGIDFRDSNLEALNFAGANLSDAKFDAARLVACRFDQAVLTRARFQHADLASATFTGATLQDANLRDVKNLNADLTNADLRGVQFSSYTVDWKLWKNWRLATFDPGIKEGLLAKHGPSVTGPRILLLLWEFPPKVAGGIWTAAYHLVRNLRRKGADIVVLLPWAKSQIDTYEFGNEVEVVPVNIEAKSEEVYSSYTPPRREKDERVSDDVETLFDMVVTFTRRSSETIAEKNLRFDVIHALDWVTFGAARTISNATGVPWIAHFHSIEPDRQKTADISIATIERQACGAASRTVVTSNVSKKRLVELYNAPEDKIVVVPNCLSKDDDPEIVLGDFHANRVVFVGRVTWQKGADLFAQVARRVRKDLPASEFLVYGQGDQENEVKETGVIEHKEIPSAQVVPPQPQEDDIRFLHTEHIQFSSIEPIEYDSETNTIARQGVLTREREKQEYAQPLDRVMLSRHDRIAAHILQRGFTAFPGFYEEGYTHRIVIQDHGDGLHRDYLVKTNNLPAANYRKEPCISFKGRQDWHRRKRAFDHATVVLVPSRHEPFGMIILEAMAAGIPVVYPECAGVAEVIESGIRIDPKNIDSMTKEVISLLSDDAHWQTVADAQFMEIEGYHLRGYEDILSDVWAHSITHNSVSK